MNRARYTPVRNVRMRLGPLASVGAFQLRLVPEVRVHSFDPSNEVARTARPIGGRASVVSSRRTSDET
jgi:hypothetical protein